MRKLSTVLTLALFCTSAAFGPLSAGASEMRVQNFNMSSGLSSGYVLSVTEDTKGYIWIATMQGLDRFDGNGFINFNKDNSGLSANELNSVSIVPHNPDQLWIATQRAGLCIMDISSGEISQVPVKKLLSPDITEVFPATDGGMWVVHYHYGPQHVDTKDFSVKDYSFKSIEGLPRRCWTAREDDSGHLYVGYVDMGFSVINCSDNSYKLYTDIPGKSVYSICIDKRGDVWLGSDYGVAKYNPATGNITKFIHSADDNTSISPGRIWDIREMDSGEIWFASSEGGVCVLDTYSLTQTDPGQVKFKNIPHGEGDSGTSSSYIRSIFQDSHGNIWLGNFRSGVDFISRYPSVFSRLPYTTHGYTHINHKPVWSCALDPTDGSMWFGGENEIVNFSDNAVRKIPLPVSRIRSRSYIRGIHVDNKGKVWCGTSERGLIIYDPSASAFVSIEGMPTDVRVIYEKNDSVYVGTARGLYTVGNNFTASPVTDINDNLNDLIIQALWIDKEGNLWVGTFGKGVHVFDNKNKKIGTLSAKEGFPSNAVNAIRGDSYGHIWIATHSGLVKIESTDRLAKYKVYGSNEGFKSHVKSIEEDYRHNIWVSTNNGLAHFDAANDRFNIYSDIDGLHLDSFMENASAKDSSGNMYFASNNGVIKFNPRDAEIKAPKTKATVTDFIVYTPTGSDNKSNEHRLYINNKKVKLAHDCNTFKIYFNLLDFGESNITEFAYNLKGLDDVWVDCDGDNSAIYRNLPPGTYHFQIKQRIKGQDWDSPYELLEIEVTHPWWATWWAKTLYVFLILGAIMLFAIIYKRKIALRQSLAAEMENNKNRQALNEERLKFYTNITHELRTPLTLITGPLEDMMDDPELPKKYSSKIQLIRDSSQRLLTLVNGILEFRKTETQNRQLSVSKGNLSNLLREIGIRYREFNRNPDVTINLDIESYDHNIYYDSDMVTTIVENLMSNAVKYTPKGMITLSLHTVVENDVRYSEIRVSDTGYGISKKGLPHIFERYYQTKGDHQASGTGIGLALVKNLIDLHQATISVVSEENKGSIFTVRLLTDNTYPDAECKPADIPGANVSHEDTPENRRNKIKILAVEDNPDIRQYISDSLGDDFEVFTAANGWEGLKCVTENNPDIVISDIMMPELDGLQMCKKLKEDILTSHIPVILLTAKDSLDDKEAGYDSGADSYLTKPFSAKLLRSRINNIMETRRKLAGRLMQKPVSENKNDGTDDIKKGENDAMEKLNPIDRQFMERIKDIINSNLANENLGVPFLTDKMCVSAATLYRKMTALLGVSANEYIRHLRLLKAVELLDSGEYTVSEIAFMTGFGNHSAFGKIFKKEYGCTATEYIKNKNIK